MNKILGITLLFLFQGVVLFGQVNFSQDLTLEQALASVQKNDKKIFIDFYTTWCAPCKTMDKEVFSNTSVGDFMNKEFINLKVDAEKGDGINLAKRFKVKAYPTFIVLNGDGQELFKFEGAQPANTFLETLQKNLDPNRQSEALAERYVNGERTPQLINDYALEIMKSGEEEKGFEIVNGYFEQLSDEGRMNAANLFLYQRYALNLEDRKIKYLIANKDAFAKQIGEAQVNAIIYRFVRVALTPYANGYYLKQNKFDEETYNTIKRTIAEVALPDSMALSNLVKIADAQTTQNQSTLMNTFESEFPNITKSDRFILMLTMGSFSEDRGLADRAARLMSSYVQDYDKGTVEILNRVLFELKEKGQGIAFQELSFQEALDRAKKENKKVFLDCFTTWCGPCKWLDDNTFRDPAVVAYFDKHFVNIKIDMEKGEGPELGKRFEIKAYPTMLVLDSSGEVVHRMQGTMDGERLLKAVK